VKGRNCESHQPCSCIPPSGFRDGCLHEPSCISQARIAAVSLPRARDTSVAFILQTGITEESGINPFAIGYVGLVTAPLFPGTDISVAAGAERCAVDVRSGVMLGCGIGRGYQEARFLFPLRASARADNLREQMVAEAVTDAASDILAQIARRVSR
jgi:hypothetical protein